jgi:GNAT superfamily N-acetyltransferase
VDEGQVVRIVGPTRHPLDDFVCHSALTAESAEAAIRAVVEQANCEGRGVQWNVYDRDEPPDLVERLERHGFAVQARETVMAAESSSRAFDVAPPAGTTLERVLREDGLTDVVEVQEAVWGNGFTEWLLAWWRPALRGEADPIGIFLARAGGAPAGTAWVALPPGGSFAGVFGGTVLPAFRRRGIHRALVAARARLARDAGIPWLVVDANDESAPLVRRLGFEPFARRTEMVRPAR